jgi:CRP-like cAMP-binding protein
MLEHIRCYVPFSDLPEEDLTLMEALFAPAVAPAGTTLFRQDQEAEILYLVNSGQVALRYKPYDGPEIGLAHVGAGGAVGWTAVTGGGSYTATAVVSVSSEILTARGSELQLFVFDHPLAGRRILDRLATAVTPRWAGAHSQVFNLLARSALERAG